MTAVSDRVIDVSCGSHVDEGEVAQASAIVPTLGLSLARLTHQDEKRVDHRDEIEAGGSSLLVRLTAAWEDTQRTRLALDQRGIPSADMQVIEDRFARQIQRELRAHPLWPWLSQYPGLGGVHTARLVALIGDPMRFPGRQCAAGHHHSAVGGSRGGEEECGCGYELADGTVCAAPIGELRPGTGTRSLWHYLGLHVVNGKSPRRMKGTRVDWNPKGRTAVLMPGGIADQIVRQRVPKYRAIYDAAKDRLSRERVTEVPDESDWDLDHPLSEGPEAAVDHATGDRSGLRPFQIDAIARKIAAKAFVADLLAEWKGLAQGGTE